MWNEYSFIGKSWGEHGNVEEYYLGIQIGVISNIWKTNSILMHIILLP